MNSYQDLRDVWTSELARHGELDRLSRSERELLEDGSLDLLAETRLRAIGRRMRWVRAVPFVRGRLEARKELYRRLRRARRELTVGLMA